MTVIEILLLAASLAMDCFAVSICVGATGQFRQVRLFLKIAFYFGLFQGGMALIGWVCGATISQHIRHVDHWIAIALLGYVGVKMILEGRKVDNVCPVSPSNDRMVLLLSVATSIDALAVGIGLGSFPSLNLWFTMGSIALMSTGFSLIGSFFGQYLGNRLGGKMEIAGGIVLVLIGTRIVVTHLVQGI